MQRTMITIVAAALGLGACASPTPVRSSGPAGTGGQLYLSLCSSCHGTAAHGDGPIAPLIKNGVPDLTLLAQRNGGEFPADGVRRTIDGRFERSAHGARDMPVWGWRLYDGTTFDDPAARGRTDALIDQLVSYLQSLQK